MYYIPIWDLIGKKQNLLGYARALWGIRVGGRRVAAGAAGAAAWPVVPGRDCLVTCDVLWWRLALVPEVGVWARGYLESCAMHWWRPARVPGARARGHLESCAMHWLWVAQAPGPGERVQSRDACLSPDGGRRGPAEVL